MCLTTTWYKNHFIIISFIRFMLLSYDSLSYNNNCYKYLSYDKIEVFKRFFSSIFYIELVFECHKNKF